MTTNLRKTFSAMLLIALIALIVSLSPWQTRKAEAETAPGTERKRTAKEAGDFKPAGYYNSLTEAIRETLGKLETNQGEDFLNRTYAQTAKLTAFDAASSDYLGFSSVAIDGDTAVVGASGDDIGTTGFDRGSVYVFIRRGLTWSLQQKLIASDGANFDGFGSYIAIDGDTIAVGTYLDDIGSNSNQGSVYVFTRSGTVWTERAKLLAPDGAPGDWFGYGVSVSRDTIAINAYNDVVNPNFNKGSAYIFVGSGSVWTQQAKLTAMDGEGDDDFAGSIDIDGDTLVTGAPETSNGTTYRHGSAYVFERSGTTWTQLQKLTAVDAYQYGYEDFGISVAVSNNTIVVGAQNLLGEQGTDQGGAYVFVRSGATWVLQAKLAAADGNRYDNFGRGVAIDGDDIIVGAPGVDISPNSSQGAAYAFRRNGTTWTEQTKFIVADGASNWNYFGQAVAVDDGTMIAGSGGENGERGAMYVYMDKTHAPDLQAESDSGASSSDNITNLRNLKFDISGVTVGATVELFRDGVPVDSGIAVNSVITLSDAEAPANGNFRYIARQTLPNNTILQGAPSFVTVDTASPTVTINQAGNQTDPTTTLPINFIVTFSEPVSEFGAADISLAGSTATLDSASITVTGSGATFNVAVSNFSTNGGVVRASVKEQAAVDAVGHLSLASTSTDNMITVDNIVPTVTINRAADQADPTNSLPINFTVVFSEPVTGFDPADVFFFGSSINTAGANINITGSGTTYNISVGNITSNGGVLRATIPSAAAADAFGNSNLSSTSSDNTVILDNVSPSVSINQANGQSDPTSTQPVKFTVVFNESVIGFGAEDISLAGSTANVSSANITVTGSGNVFTVNVSNITSSGQVRASLAAGAAQDSRGNLNFASTSADNTITVNVKRSFIDFDGDGKSDISVFRPSAGSWYLLQSSNSSFFGISFGLGSDVIAPADYDGDGRADFAVFRPDTGSWYLQQSTNGFTGVQFGQNGDIPVPADYDGDGKADIAVYRPSTGGWYRLNSSTGGFVAVAFGTSEDKPTVGDFDGDGKADIAVFRSSTANWFRLNSSNGQFVAVPFGAADDKLTPADFDGDGKTDIAVFRPSTGGWYRLNSSNGEFVAVGFGIEEDKPVAADYDGDGKADIAVFRPSDSNWYLLRSTAGFAAVQFGTSEDKPVPNAFVR